MKNRTLPALLVLEDGSVFQGKAFAGRGEVFGEVVFNTGMTGYQEVLTDPSYYCQIVTMTYPLIGNYGINDEDMESTTIYMEGFVVKEYQPYPSNWRSRRTLAEFLELHGKIGVEDIDTRALTRWIRTKGAMKGVISTETSDVHLLLEKLKVHPGLVGRDLVSPITCPKPYLWERGNRKWIEYATKSVLKQEGKLLIAVLDCGVKFSILRCLETLNCQVLVLPAHTSAEEILSYEPDGVLLSNGPGDPAPLTFVVETVRNLLGKVPIFGICLGHQILGQALGGKTEKLKFGHRGLNQPVLNYLKGKIEITSQNHGFIVTPVSLQEKSLIHRNLNDDTVEGIYFPEIMAMGVQYHPEAAPGPHDTRYLFEIFIDLIKSRGAHAPKK